MKRVLFYGSKHRFFGVRQKIINILNTLDVDQTIIIHGNFSAVDKLVDMEARKLGFKIETHCIQWEINDKSSCDEKIIRGVDRVFVFPQSEDVENMVTQAGKFGVPVEIN